MIKEAKEVWKAWPENVEKEVSSRGRFRSIHGHYYKPWIGNGGYLQVTFRMNGKWVHKKVHRLVAQTFLQNKNNWAEVNHKDCDRTNNCVENLEWCTRAYNREYKEKFGKSQSRPVFAVNLSTLKVFWFESQCEAGRAIGANVGCVSSVTRGKSRATKSFWFTNADDNAIIDAKDRLYKLVGDKINDLRASDDSKEVIEFIVGLQEM